MVFQLPLIFTLALRGDLPRVGFFVVSGLVVAHAVPGGSQTDSRIKLTLEFMWARRGNGSTVKPRPINSPLLGGAYSCRVGIVPRKGR